MKTIEWRSVDAPREVILGRAAGTGLPIGDAERSLHHVGRGNGEPAIEMPVPCPARMRSRVRIDEATSQRVMRSMRMETLRRDSARVGRVAAPRGRSSTPRAIPDASYFGIKRHADL